MQIPMCSPDLTGQEQQKVLEVLNSRHLSIGPHIREFEAEFAAYVGVRHAAGVSSGTAALHMAMIAAEVHEGDFVITTPFSFVASANAVLYERGVPIFVDVDPLTGNIDPTLVLDAVSALAAGGDDARRWLPPSLGNGRPPHPSRLKVLLPVHCFGQPASMTTLVETAARYGLTLVEDACEAIGAAYCGRRVGTFGDAATFAFYPNKQMTTGEGGILVTNRSDWDALVRSLRNQGRDVFDVWLKHTRLGYNYRLDELSAALGRVQLQRLDELLARRERVASWYTERLVAQRPLIEPPQLVPETTRMSWFVYVVRLGAEIDRAALLRDLETRGVPTRPYFSPIHLQPFYRERFGYTPGDFPVTEDLGNRCLALPFSGVMTEEQVQYVTTQLAAAAERHRSPVAA